MHIMIFGGSFNPPHNGHTSIIDHVLNTNICNEVWYVPCGKHPFDKTFLPSKYRVNMLKLIQTPKTKILTYEIDKKGKSFSFDTLEYFSKTHPQDTFSWLMGSDQLKYFHKWKNYDQLLTKYKVYVYPREGYPIDQKYSNMITLTSTTAKLISSTQIRNFIKDNKPFNQVSNLVYQYIIKHSLYKE